MTQEELQTILEKHKKWLNNVPGGKCANLEGANRKYANLEDADLEYANLAGANLGYANLKDADLASASLRGANLKDANLEGANLEGANLERAHLECADLRGANLEDADLEGANLASANLKGANLDYSCWPLWCGSLRNVRIDKRIFAQLAYHICRVIVDDDECKAAQRALYPIANQFHRANECGRLPLEGSESHDD